MASRTFKGPGGPGPAGARIPRTPLEGERRSYKALENQCTGIAGGRAVPPDVREEPGRALYVHPLSHPVRV